MPDIVPSGVARCYCMVRKSNVLVNDVTLNNIYTLFVPYYTPSDFLNVILVLF